MKKIYFFPLIILITVFLFQGKVFAITESNYWCTINPSVQDLTQCCYPKSPDYEPYQGQECRADSAGGIEYFLTNYSGAGLTCSSDEAAGPVMTRINTAIAANRLKFNCFTGATQGCYPSATYCESGGTCQARTNPACTENTRQDVCPGGCGACISGYVHCEGSEEYFNPSTLDGATPVTCQPKAYCTQPGQTTANFCTGSCETGCGDNYVQSGDPNDPGCVTFKKRFKQIFDSGLTVLGGRIVTLGGVELLNAYAYGSLGDQPTSDNPSESEFYGSIFVEVDQADHVNWSSPSVPGPIRSLITGSDLFFCDENNLCQGNQICTAGVCNTPGAAGAATASCGSSSDCNFGLICLDDQCSDPNNPNNALIPCSYDDPCAAGSCVQGYCHGNAGEEEACTSDQTCVAGLVCTEGSCVPYNLAPPPVFFMGFSNQGSNTYVFNSILSGGYSAANTECGDAFEDSHVCTAEEILTIFNTNPDNLVGITGEGWINGGPPGFTAKANDCVAWTSKDGSAYGRYWNFTDSTSWLRFCTAIDVPFACCN